jgi:hypothetical protein
MSDLDRVWRSLSRRERAAMVTDHMALRVRGRQDSRRWIAELLSKRSPKQVFARFDANGDGHISRREFRTALAREFRVDPRVADEVFRQWDTDRSGTLEYAELARAMNKSVRRAANTVAHSVDSMREGRSASVDAIQRKFLRSVARRGSRDVSPAERRMARAVLRSSRRRRSKK